MKKCLVGVCGIGTGHTVRQMIIAEYLKKYSDIVFVVSGRRGSNSLLNGYKVIHSQVPWIITDARGVNWRDTSVHASNNEITFLNISKTLASCIELLGGEPDIIISDYEPFVPLLAYSKNIPLITIDQQSKYLGYLTPSLANLTRDMEASRLSLLFPKANKRFSVSFFPLNQFEENMDFKVDILPAIVPNDILALSKNVMDIKDKLITVYISSFAKYEQGASIIKCLTKYKDYRFNIFSNHSFKNSEYACNLNLSFFSYDRNKFLNSVINSRFLIATAGHQLISEAVYLKKPILAIPVESYEQFFNAKMCKELYIGDTFDNFNLENLDMFIKNAEKGKYCGMYDLSMNRAYVIEKIIDYINNILR